MDGGAATRECRPHARHMEALRGLPQLSRAGTLGAPAPGAGVPALPGGFRGRVGRDVHAAAVSSARLKDTPFLIPGARPGRELAHAGMSPGLLLSSHR